jgi:DNA polymerase-3 subunit chi
MSNGPDGISFLNADGRPLVSALGRYLEAQNIDGGVLVLCLNKERVSELDDGLWTFDPASFLAHGAEGEHDSTDHPIWITTTEPDGPRSRLIVVDDAAPKNWLRYSKCAYIFDAQDPSAREIARSRWRQWSEDGKRLAYWNFDGESWQLKDQN